MKLIGNLDIAEKELLTAASNLLSEVSKLSGAIPKTAEDAVGTLAQVRDIAYENLNQIQHEYLILLAARHLVKTSVASLTTQWHWNPRQTGGASEPDLQGKENATLIVSAEITTSRRPIGTIADRMKSTLNKLSGFPGAKYYFVRTNEMANRAKGICRANNYEIDVIYLPYNENDL